MSDETQGGPAPPQPGPEHEKLSAFAGEFRAKVTLWMGPDNVETTGTMTNTMQVDGLYLHQDYVGDPNEGPLPAFVGKGYWGYNQATGNYEGFWIDNASTMMQTETGSLNDEGTVWTMTSSFIHPATGQTVSKRSEITLLSADEHTMVTWFDDGSGQEFKTMEIHYRRSGR